MGALRGKREREREREIGDRGHNKFPKKTLLSLLFAAFNARLSSTHTHTHTPSHPIHVDILGPVKYHSQPPISACLEFNR